MYNIEMKSGRPARRSFESGQLTAKAYLKDKDKENEFTKESTSQPFRSKPCYTVQCHDNYRGGATHYPYECPVEILTQEPLSSEERRNEIEKMEEEFRARRKTFITGLPHDCSEEDLTSFFKEFSCAPVSKVKDGSVRVLFSTAVEAKDSIGIFNSTIFKSQKLCASYGHADSLLFVGNLPFTYTRDDLSSLFRPHGDILRCLLVLSPKTGLSKGYGFVEYAKREEAMLAKQHLATKVIGLRSLRVDFSDNGMQTCDDLHSQTLFVDRLPKGFKDDVALKEIFCQYGRVNFCQVATTPGTGVSRGFAFVDMSTSEEAEHAQIACNGRSFFGQDIRVSFGMPCRHGACILQHKNSVQFKAAGKLTGTVVPSRKEELSICTTKYPSHFCQSADVVGHSGGIAPSYSDSCLHFSGRHHHHNIHLPLRELNTEATNPTSANRIDPFPNGYQPISKHFGISKSHSAPSVLDTLSSNTPQNSLLDWRPAQDEVPEKDSSCSVLGKKRPLSLELSTTQGVYDKAYIGQHQQGIPFTHPLKRIRMED